MKVIKAQIHDVKVSEPKIQEDPRGVFVASFNHAKFEQAIARSVTFVQDNHSMPRQGMLRGLHYRLAPRALGKLVRVVQGEVFDVAVDIRQSSPTFGHWVGEPLSASIKNQHWISEGFAHGFLTLGETAEFSTRRRIITPRTLNARFTGKIANSISLGPRFVAYLCQTKTLTPTLLTR